MARTRKANRTIHNPTDEYNNFEQAFQFFNTMLFRDRLPTCLITLQRKPGTMGYFSYQRFKARELDAQTDEIALNPATFSGRTDEDILATLVHEMTHLWQAHFGEPARGRYHNAEWADQMEALGLMPSDTGLPGGRRVGQRVTHYIIPGGLFADACAGLLRGGFRLTWQSPDPAPRGRAPVKDRIKFTCGACGLNAWAKPAAHLVCGDCSLRMEPARPRAQAKPGTNGSTNHPPLPGPEVDGCPSGLRQAVEVLELRWPCTAAQVRKAYRRLSKKRHPDVGGTHEGFIELQNAYEQLLGALKEKTASGRK